MCQPYADMIARGEKTIENRTWSAPRPAIGQRLAIHAGRSRSWLCADDIADRPRMVFGSVLCTATLVACHHIEFLPTHLKGNLHANGPWCWELADIVVLPAPVPVRGAQGLWNWTPPAVALTLTPGDTP